MGTYRIGKYELICKLDDFLRSQEGEIHADEMARAWNYLAKQNLWSDRLKAYNHDGVE